MFAPYIFAEPEKISRVDLVSDVYRVNQTEEAKGHQEKGGCFYRDANFFL